MDERGSEESGCVYVVSVHVEWVCMYVHMVSGCVVYGEYVSDDCVCGVCVVSGCVVCGSQTTFLFACGRRNTHSAKSSQNFCGYWNLFDKLGIQN